MNGVSANPKREPTHGAVSNPLGAREALLRLLARVRRRWRMRRVAEASAVVAGLLLVTALGSIAAMNFWRFDPAVVEVARIIVYILAALGTFAVVAWSGLRKLSNLAVARYIESRVPEFDALLLSATEVASRSHSDAPLESAESQALAERLLGNAVEAWSHARRGPVLDRRRLRRASMVVVAVVCVGLIAVHQGPHWLRHGAWLLVAPLAEGMPENPYAIRVAPGNIRVLEGMDRQVSATPVGFSAERMVLLSRPLGSRQWTRQTMQRIGDGAGFEGWLIGVATPLEYYVEGERLQSERFAIDVLPRPKVDRIDLIYHYPSYTGQAPRMVNNGGDISAVHGTRVELLISANASAKAGSLIVDGADPIPLRALEGRLRAEIDVQQNGHYRIELVAGDLGPVAASPEYAIAALEDLKPTVEIVSPGRDRSVTSIEELEFELQAQDDLGVRALELLISINGGEEQVIPLGDSDASGRWMDGRHTLFLETQDVAPGDLVAYYARARDADTPDRSVSTDIYFVDVRPFDRTFRSASGRSGGGGGANEEILSAQQRELVVALFKLVRDRSSFAADAFEERLDTVADAQTRIRDRVDAIARRLKARSIVDVTPSYRVMAEQLPKAAASMLRVEASLVVHELEHALLAARQALLHLQRADAAVREVRVAHAEGAGGRSANELANLFRLEMDKLRSQYEDVKRGHTPSPEAQLDEVMRKLRELARRQEQELERARQRAARGMQGAESQKALAEDVAALARELERLTRHQSTPQTRQSLSNLEQAAAAMSGRSGSSETQAGEAALEALREARTQLEAQGGARLAGDIEGARQRAAQIAAEQQGVARGVESLSPETPPQDPLLSGLVERKRRMADQLRDLEAEVAQLARAARKGEPKAARRLVDALNASRQERVAEAIEDSASSLKRGSGKYNHARERRIGAALVSLTEGIGAAAGAVGESEDERLARAVGRLGEQLRELAASSRGSNGAASGGGDITGGGAIDADGGPGLVKLQRHAREHAERLSQIADDFSTDPEAAADVRALVEALEETAALQQRSELLARQASVLERLKTLEFRLRSEVEADRRSALATMHAEPTWSDRDIVDAYYRNLSEE